MCAVFRNILTSITSWTNSTRSSTLGKTNEETLRQINWSIHSVGGDCLQKKDELRSRVEESFQSRDCRVMTRDDRVVDNLSSILLSPAQSNSEQIVLSSLNISVSSICSLQHEWASMSSAGSWAFPHPFPLTNWWRKKREENQELGKSSSATTRQMGTLTNFIHQAVRYTATIRVIELDISAKSQTSPVFYFAH